MEIDKELILAKVIMSGVSLPCQRSYPILEFIRLNRPALTENEIDRLIILGATIERLGLEAGSTTFNDVNDQLTLLLELSKETRRESTQSRL